MSRRDPFCIARRDFVRGTVGGLAIIGCGVTPGCGNVVSVPETVRAAVDTDESSPTFGHVVVNVGEQLSLLGAAVTVEITNRPSPGTLPFDVPAAMLLVHRGEAAATNAWIAVDSRCPHAGCPLGYSPKDDLIECPCHGSRFRAVADTAVDGSCTGSVVHGPSAVDARAYAVAPAGSTVIIDVRTSACIDETNVPRVVDGKLALVVSQFPELAMTDGARVFPVVEGYPDPIAVVRTGASTFIALNAKCTHLCCTVAYQGSRWLCPCHGSTYDVGGKVLVGPARFDLVQFATSYDGTTLTISNFAPETQNDC